MTWSIEQADVLAWAAGYEGEKFHALLTDSPYSLHFMGKSWDKDIAFQSETWEALTEHLYPGAFGMSFASARGWHRLACAIEDAGLIIHPSIFMLGWLQGQGFPKASRVGKNGDHPEFEGHRYGLQAMKPAMEPIIVFQKPYEGKPVECITSTGAGALWIDGARVACTDKADFPAGVISETESVFGGGNGRYADRPRTQDSHTQGRWPANVVLQHVAPDADGNGGCVRVGTRRVRGEGGRNIKGNSRGSWFGPDNNRRQKYHDPDGLETVDEWQCVDGWQIVEPPAECLDCHQPDPASGWPEQEQIGQIVDYGGIEFKCQHCGERQEWEFARALCPVKALGEQSGERKSTPFNMKRMNSDETIQFKTSQQHEPTGGYSDTGTAARFFPQFSWQHEVAERSFDYAQDRLAGVTPFWYVAKSSRKERDSGLDSCEIVMVQLHQENKSSGGVTWELEDQQVKLLVDTAQSQPRVIAASTSEKLNATEWSTFLFGNSTTDQSLMATTSITLTATNLITGSKTLSWLTRSLTSAYTQDVNSETGNGGSPAESAELSSPSMSFTNAETVYLPGVGNVASGTQWTISASEELGDGKKKGPVMNRVCVNCGKGELDVRRAHPCCGSPEYINAAPRGNVRNHHPCCKPIALTRWLATLLLPPPEYAPRRLLVPFSGSGSEMIGSFLAGWDEIIGVEMEEEYCAIGEARLRFWATWAGRGFDDPKAILKEAKKEAKKAEAQMELKL